MAKHAKRGKYRGQPGIFLQQTEEGLGYRARVPTLLGYTGLIQERKLFRRRRQQ